MPEITARLSTALADRYKIESHLGAGSMATYVNENPWLERTIVNTHRSTLCTVPS